MNTLALIEAFLSAVAEVAPIIKMNMESKLKNSADLQAAKDGLLKEWKAVYASHDLSAVVDALRRMRQSK